MLLNWNWYFSSVIPLFETYSLSRNLIFQCIHYTSKSLVYQKKLCMKFSIQFDKTKWITLKEIGHVCKSGGESFHVWVLIPSHKFDLSRMHHHWMKLQRNIWALFSTNDTFFGWKINFGLCITIEMIYIRQKIPKTPISPFLSWK
jgi:hypothetical protein